MKLPILKSVDVKSKAVILRGDFDVPLTSREDAIEVEDDFRLQKGLATIKDISSRGGKIIAVGHLGRPKGADSKFSLAPVARRLADLLHRKYFDVSAGVGSLPGQGSARVLFFSGPINDGTFDLVKRLDDGDVAVLENLRFYPGEDAGDEKFAGTLARLGDLYVNDSLSSSYSERSSIAVLPRLLPHFAGLQLAAEVDALSKILQRPARPYVVLAGGVKLSDKLEGIAGLVERCDYALIGGGLATLFFQHRGYAVGSSITDTGPGVRRLIADLLRNYKDKIRLPSDVVVARDPKRPETVRVTAPNLVQPDEMILDIGPDTIRDYSGFIKTAKTMVWSGPLGLFEVPQFSHGTRALGRLFASRSKGAAFGVAGGGNTLDAIKTLQMGEYIDCLSTAGSAMLQFLGGKELPGIAALLNS